MTSKGLVIYDTPGTFNFIVPEGVTKVFYEIIGGGGAGGRGTSPVGGGGTCSAGGGGSGGYAFGVCAVQPGKSYPAVVGAGGVASASANGNGTSGGSSSFNGFVATGGGCGRRGYPQDADGGAGGAPGTPNGAWGHNSSKQYVYNCGGTKAYRDIDTGGNGGGPFGGCGATHGRDAQNGGCGSGGGGGGDDSTEQRFKGGNGGPGLVRIFW